jgi:hypothetical protein
VQQFAALITKRKTTFSCFGAKKQHPFRRRLPSQGKPTDQTTTFFSLTDEPATFLLTSCAIRIGVKQEMFL